jgi:hypothetical protein
MTYGVYQSFGGPQSQGFHPLRIGAGGFVTTIDISPDGSSRLIGTDTSGAFIWSALTGNWQQLVLNPYFPDASASSQLGAAWHVLSAPSDPTRIYLGYVPGVSSGSATGYIYRSDNRAVSFARTAYALSSSADGNSGAKKVFGPKMAVDLVNKDVLYLADGDGTFHVTSNGGGSWASVPNVPTATATVSSQVIAGAIVFDPTSTTSGGIKQGIYVYSPGNGVYHSTNGGTSFALVAGGPASYTPSLFYAGHMKITTDGVLYLTQKSDTPANSRLWRYQSGAWTDMAPNIAGGTGNAETIFVDPSGSNPSLVGCGVDGGFIYVSSNYGAIFVSGGTQSRTATNIAWFAVAAESYMTIGDMVMDPVVAGRLWFAEGIGIWYSTSPNYNAWLESSIGIENMIYNWVICPPNGYPVICCSDRPFFTSVNPNQFPSGYGPNYDHAIAYGASADWASSTPSYVVGLDTWVDESNSYSTNKGLAWTRFAGNAGQFAAGKTNGAIAASTTTNIVYIPSNRGDVWRTHDGGATWAFVPAANFGGTGMQNASGSVDTGWPWAYYLRAQIVCADRTSANTFYAHNWQTAALGGGIYRSTDGGDNWTRRSTFFCQGGGTSHSFTSNNAKLRSVPNLSGTGTAGHLFFSAGDNDSDALYYSIDGGSTWTAVGSGTSLTGMNRCFGFGAVKPGNNYPSIYCVGYVNNVWGIWRSDNTQAEWAANTINWINLGAFPLGSVGQAGAIEGNHDTWGLFYMATLNGGIYYYQP